jgi:hypothetical protein
VKAVVSGAKKRWFLPAFIALGVLCLLLIGSKLGPSADAQAQLQTGMEDGIMVIPVQIGRDSYGIAMVDTAEQTLWIYEINNRGPAYNRLRLLAARSWRYDRLLQQFNTAEPKPEQVKILLESLGGQIKEPSKEKRRDSDINVFETTEPNKQ